MKNQIARSKIIEEIRKFFWARQFIETDTPALVFSPGMEPHICPITVADRKQRQAAFLHTSPEFAMKRILATPGAPKNIFQICKCYRLEPKSSTHQPEFTMLEWYRTHSDYEAIMKDVEELFKHLGEKKSFAKFTVEEAFQKFAGVNLADFLPHTDPANLDKFAKLCVQKKLVHKTDGLIWDDCFFLIIMNLVEPAFEKLDQPVIIHLYPESQAALSNLTTDSRGFKWAKRFEVYAGGFELANAFDELTDPKAQRTRFEKDMALRRELYGDENAANHIPQSPMDEDFLKCLTNLPPSGGIALGVDRLVMYLTKTSNIRDTLWQEPHWS